MEAPFSEADAGRRFRRTLLDVAASADSGRLLRAADPDSLYLAGKDSLELAARLYDTIIKPAAESDFHSLLLDGERNAALAGWESAINKYQRALKLRPDRPDVHFALGSACLESGNYAAAEDSFRRCVELAPDSVWARLLLVLTLIEESKSSEAQRIFLSLNADDLESASEYQDVLWIARFAKLPEISSRALDRAQQRFPFQGDWHEWSALLAVPVRESEGGSPTEEVRGLSGVGLTLRFFLTSKQAKGNDFAAVFPTSTAYQNFRSDFLSGEWMRATAEIIPILKSSAPNENSAARALALGEMLHCLAYGFHQQLGLQFPDSTPAMRLAAENLADLGEPQKALEIYQAIEQKGGPSPDIISEMARIYWSDHKWEQALEILEPLSRMDPDDATIFVNMGAFIPTNKNRTPRPLLISRPSSCNLE